MCKVLFTAQSYKATPSLAKSSFSPFKDIWSVFISFHIFKITLDSLSKAECYHLYSSLISILNSESIFRYECSEAVTSKSIKWFGTFDVGKMCIIPVSRTHCPKPHWGGRVGWGSGTWWSWSITRASWFDLYPSDNIKCWFAWFLFSEHFNLFELSLFAWDHQVSSRPSSALSPYMSHM